MHIFAPPPLKRRGTRCGARCASVGWAMVPPSLALRPQWRFGVHSSCWLETAAGTVAAHAAPVGALRSWSYNAGPMMLQPEPLIPSPPADTAYSWPLRQYVIAAAALTAVILVFFLPQALRGVSLGEGEGVTFYLPMRVLVADAWRHGHWPAWNPYVYGGMPLLADCQAGAFYPPNLLYLWLTPLAAMNAILLGEKVLAAWGMVLLLRAYRVSPLSAAVGAGVFTFGGFMVAHMGHVSIVNAAAWIPWICLVTYYWCVKHRCGGVSVCVALA